MESKKIAILMSTYNGEKYIYDQIQSILNQEYKNFNLIIRDDCSYDKTVKIIESFDDERIIFIKGEKNLGYPEGFYELLKMRIEADYYSFSDQDDIWHKTKLKNAVEKLEGCREDIPVLYFSAYNLSDKNCKTIKTLPDINFQPTFRMSLFQCLALGYTMVLNNKAKEMALEYRSKEIVSKDVWIGMLCSGLGEIIYDNRPSAQWRRNGGSFSGDEKNFIKIQMARFGKLFKNNGFCDIKILMKEFLDRFGNNLNKEDYEELLLFSTNKNRLKKVFYKKRLRYVLIDDIMLRVMFLLGKI